MTQIDKGFISSFEAAKDDNDNFMLARVLPASSQTMPTRPLVIPWHLRGKMGNLKVNDLVWFALADDLSGIILARADGSWGSYVPGSVEIEKDVKVGTSLTAVDDVTAGGISLKIHEHPNGNNGSSTGAPT